MQLWRVENLTKQKTSPYNRLKEENDKLRKEIFQLKRRVKREQAMNMSLQFREIDDLK